MTEIYLTSYSTHSLIDVERVCFINFLDTLTDDYCWMDSDRGEPLICRAEPYTTDNNKTAHIVKYLLFVEP
jgi:hypothetical protein